MTTIDKEIEAALKDYHKEIVEDVVRPRVYNAAYSLFSLAIENRRFAPGAHNFTGNLLNSIVVAVYEDGKPDVAYFSSGYIKGAIHVKMTYPKKYHFDVDYDGTVDSVYKPDVETDQGWGAEDAKEFVSNYRPEIRAKFVIVVAYPVEYASYVESERHTVGFEVTFKAAKRVSNNVLKLPKWDGYYSVIEEAPF